MSSRHHQKLNYLSLTKLAVVHFAVAFFALPSCTLKLETSVYEGQFSADALDIDDTALSCKVSYRELHADKLDRDSLTMLFYSGSTCSGTLFSRSELSNEDGVVEFSPGAPGVYSFVIQQIYEGTTTTSSCLGHVLLGSPEAVITSHTLPITLTESTNYTMPLSGTCLADDSQVSLSTQIAALTPITTSAVCENSTWSMNVDFSSLPSGSYQSLLSATFDEKVFSTEVGLVILPRSASVTTSTLLASPSILPYGNTSTITVTLRDSLGVPKVGETVVLSATGGSATLTQPLTTTDSSGVVTATLTSVAPASSTVSITTPLSLSALSTSIVFSDGTPPTLSGVVADGTHFNSLTSTPSLTWTAGVDTVGVDHYEIAIGSSSGATDVLAWAAFTSTNSGVYTHGSNLFSSGSTYFPSIRAVDGEGNRSSAILGDGWTVDTTAPSVASVTLSVPENSYSLSLSPTIRWTSATDGASGVSSYEVKIGSTSGGEDILPWSPAGSGLSIALSGLSLTRGSTYFPSLRATDTAGNTSSAVVGTGWSVLSELPVVDGSVSTMIRQGHSLYIGGSFNLIAPWSGGAFPITLASGSLAWPNPANRARVAGTVYTIAAAATPGAYYVGGDFLSVNGTSRGSIALIRADGTLDSTFAPVINGSVRALALSGTTLYVGGSFTQIDGISRNRIGKMHALTGALDTGFDPQASSDVNTIIADGSYVYAGGAFTSIGGASRNRVARLDATTGSATSFNPNPNNTIYSLALNGGYLYLGGNFASLSGSSTFKRLARVDPISGVRENTFHPTITSGRVNSIGFSGTNLYFAGNFTTVDFTSRNGAAMWDLSGNALDLTFDPNCNGEMNTILFSGGNLYMGGAATSCGSTSLFGAAKFDTVSGAIDTTFAPNIGGAVKTLAVSGNGTDLLVGGSLNLGGGLAQKGLAKINLLTGLRDSSFSPNSNGSVNAIILNGADLFVGGSFTSIGGASRNNLARIQSETGAIVSSFNASLDGSYVSTFVLDGSSLFVGGNFADVGGTFRGNIAKLNALTGALDTGFTGGTDYPVSSLVKVGTSLYAGGMFESNGCTGWNPYLAKLDASTGAPECYYGPVPNSDLNTLFDLGSSLYLLGSFYDLGGTPINRVARLDRATGVLDTSLNLNPNAHVSTMMASGSSLYFGGQFTALWGTTLSGLGRVAEADGAIDTSFTPAFIGANGGAAIISAILGSDDIIWVGGSFSSGGGGPGNLVPISSTTGQWLPGF